MPSKKTTNPILLEMRVGFREIFREMHQGFESIDRRFESMDRRFSKIDDKFSKIDKRLKVMSTKLATQGRSIKNLITRDEFTVYKNENNTRLDTIVKTLEEMDTESKASTAVLDRLVERVDVHEAALIKHKILAAV